MNQEFNEKVYVKGRERDPYRFKYLSKSQTTPQTQPQQQQQTCNELTDTGTLSEVLNEITEKVGQTIGQNKEPCLYRQVITVPGPPGKMLTAYRRLPSPQPDVLQRVYIVKPQRDVIDLVISCQNALAAQLTERTIYSRPHKPIIIPRLVQQQQQQGAVVKTGGQFTNNDQLMEMNQRSDGQLVDWPGRFDNRMGQENQAFNPRMMNSNQGFTPFGQYNYLNQGDVMGNDLWLDDQYVYPWSGQNNGINSRMGQMNTNPLMDPYTFNYDLSPQNMNPPFTSYQ